MNYYGPIEIQDQDGRKTGRWRYCIRNDRLGARAIGYCSLVELCPKCHGQVDIDSICEECQNSGLVLKEDSCPGHPTPDAACEHQKKYEIDHADLDGYRSQVQHRCLVCQGWTNRFARVGVGNTICYALCDQHRDKESLEQIHQVGESIGSY